MRTKEVKLDNKSDELPEVKRWPWRLPKFKFKKAEKSANPKKRRLLRRVLLGIFLTLIFLSIPGTYFVVIPAIHVKESVDKVELILGQLSADLDQKDLTRLESRFGEINNEIDKINSEIDKFEFLKTTDLTKGYYENLQIIKSISTKVKAISKGSLPKLTPILAAAGYKTTSNETAAEEIKMEKFIAQAPQLLSFYEQIEPQIIDIAADFGKVNPAYVPAIGSTNWSGLITDTQTYLKSFPDFSSEFKRVFRFLPQLLGVGKPANYLVIFQNEKEMRASGGLMTAYGLLTVNNGELSDEITAKDVWNLHDDLLAYSIYPKIYSTNGQLFLMTYNSRCGASITRPQDSGIYPDQYQTITTFLKYYDAAANHRRLASQYPQYDHVIILNTFFASNLMKFVEPVEVPEYKLTVTSENMAQVLTDYFNTTAAFGKVQTETRKDLIKVLATKLKDKFQELPADKLIDVAKSFLQNVISRHISFYSKDPNLQNYFDEMSFSGRVTRPAQYNGDYFMHSEAQYCALKSNFYVRDDVNIDVEIGGDSLITKTVKVDWRNEGISIINKQEVIPGYIINPTGQYPYAAWSRIIVPNGSVFLNSDGQKQSGTFNYKPKQYYDKTIESFVFESVLQFRHVRKEGEDVKRKSIATKYRLPDNLNFNPETGYNTLLVKHAGKADEKYIFKVIKDGQTYNLELYLDRDKLVTWKDGQFFVANYDSRLDKYIQIADELSGFFKD